MRDPFNPTVPFPNLSSSAPADPSGWRGRAWLGWALVLALVGAGILLALHPFERPSLPAQAPLPAVGTAAQTAPHPRATPGKGGTAEAVPAASAAWPQGQPQRAVRGHPALRWTDSGGTAASSLTAPRAQPAKAAGSDARHASSEPSLMGMPATPGAVGAEPSLSGRVLDGDGYPLVGISVQARAERLLEALLNPAVRAEGATTTGVSGQYAFTDLAEGQYRIAAEAPGFAKAQISAQTGTQDADLVLHWETNVWVWGQLTSRGSKPIEGARVTPNLSPAVSVASDAEGRYELSVNLRENLKSFEVRFEHPKHAPQSRRVDEASWEPTGAVELNLALEPIPQTTTVVGRLQSTRGEAVAGETVILYTPSLMRRFEGVSGRDGGFRIAEVAVAPDYLVSVRPHGPYQDYTERDVDIGEGTPLWIPLEPMENGTLFGRMVDPYGNPVPNLTLMLQSTSAAGRILAVTGDGAGEFMVTDVPYGELVFLTYSYPHFLVTNLTLGPQTGQVPLVLDWGPYEVRGRVIDEAGFALPAPEIYLTWSRDQGGMRSTAVRRTAADAEGYFRFARLGPGPHAIAVNAPGYRTGRLDQSVGSGAQEVVVQLQPEGL